MKAFVCTEFGPVDNCAVEEIELRPPDDDQVLIEVHSASLNFPDALMVEGRYQFKPPLPFSPGMDLAGIVREVGTNITHVAPGDKVIAFSGHGAFAEMCLAPRDKIVPMPAGMTFDAAAAFGITYSTAIHAFQECGRLQPGETVLVLGAAGGVGIAAIEVAKAMGARVIAAASTDEKLALCREKGADLTINYNSEDLRKRTLELTDGRGADVIFDPVGGEYSMTAFRATAWGGRLLVVGFAAGDIPRIPLNYALLSERSIVGVFWGAWAARDVEGQRRNLATMARWFTEGKIAPVIDSTIDLAQIPEAMKRLMDRKVKGKVVVRVRKA
ncbi:NADPH:quinone oxidoreductase family protein [Desulfatitalea alkaliphila]|uniref:NADPH:quinone oxidoreductase family protein n=1 Tax=Desulfatitalea alkaliphila TaxID=2929485 RepID=A0AA41R5Y3_9BACT|nr:NADPH:quinone oxidoreductase family protein [Desulfatitalea alkaliphila]MCJ8501710.1 NADPH:quinone oxidoreductase family protein [Desulfatitalea alkaliphila]